MKSHFDHAIKLKTAPECKSLYKWALTEVLPANRSTSDQIPWHWTLGFTAKDCIAVDGLNMEPNYSLDGPPKEPTVVEQQSLRLRLRPGIAHEGRDWAKARYSMFGTNRNIEEFWLNIHIASDEQTETCNVWGCVSYTAEQDFRDVKQDDILIFILYVKPAAFDRFTAIVRAGYVDQITFTVGEVAGFYSDWSPSISTSDVKVLTADAEHRIENAEGHEITPPRLGKIEKCTLSINRTLSFSMPAKDALPGAEPPLIRHVALESPAPAAVFQSDPQVQKLLASVRSAAWWIVGLLAIIAFKGSLH